MDGGGARGMSAVTALRCLVEQVEGNPEVCEAFDFICGTSTGAIIGFLTGLRQESSAQAVERYNELIQQIFVKSALSKSLMLFTTASYDESHFMGILSDILQDEIMLDSRSDPNVPYVFAVSSKMSSTPTHVALFRNYNYANGELADPFAIDPNTARAELDLPLESEHTTIRNGDYCSSASDGSTAKKRTTGRGSRHPGSFRVLQRYALRASTAAPTFFKPVMMGGEMYCDGGIVASNPTAVAIHEAKTLFPHVPIELVVSIGTGMFYEQKNAPRIGWDGILGQIVNSATDAEQVHHILEDLLGDEDEDDVNGNIVGGGGPAQLDWNDGGAISRGNLWDRIRSRRPRWFSLFASSYDRGQRRRSRRSQTTKAAVAAATVNNAPVKTRYFRFNPMLGPPDEFPIDLTEPEKLNKLKQITRNYMNQPEQQARLKDISDILQGRQPQPPTGGDDK